MFKNFDSLQDVEISNFNNIEEIMITADDPPSSQCNFSLFILFCLLFSTIILSSSNSLQNYFQINSNIQEITSSNKLWTHHVKSKVSNISPHMSSFLLTIVLSTPFPADTDKNSVVDIFNNNQFLKFKPHMSSSINLFKNGQYLKFINLTLLNSKVFDKIKNGNESNQVNNIFYITKDKIMFAFDIFYSESILFDSIQIDLDMYGKLSEKEEVELVTKTKNDYLMLIMLIFRIICSIFLINEIIFSLIISKVIKSIFDKGHQKKDNSINKSKKESHQTINIEILMTFILTILCLFYVDPFLLVHYFRPSTAHLSFKVASRDIFFSYLFFYSISIFDYFERRNKIHNESSEANKNQDESDDEKKLNYRMILTFIFSVLVFIFLFVQNTSVQTLYSVFPKVPFLLQNNIVSNTNSENVFDQITRRLNVTYDSLNICHFIVLAFCVILIPLKIFFTYSDVKKNITSNRYIYYSVTILTFLVLLVLYSLIKLRFYTSSSKTIPVDHFYSQNTHKLIGRKKSSADGNDGNYCFVNESFFCSVFPMTLFTVFVVLMARGHHDAEIDIIQSDAYARPDSKENDLKVDIDEKK